MSRTRGHVVFWLLLGLGVVADLVSKHWAFQFLQDRAQRRYEIWPGIFRLSRAYNDGGPFSILAGQSVLLVGFTFVAVAVIFYLYIGSVREGRGLTLVSLAFIAAGALGNLYDRIFFEQGVRDFLDFYVINYPVFNVADILITVGAMLLIIEMLRPSHPEADKAAVDETGGSNP